MHIKHIQDPALLINIKEVYYKIQNNSCLGSFTLLYMRPNNAGNVGPNKVLPNIVICGLVTNTGNSEAIRFHPQILSFSIKSLMKTSAFVWWQNVNASHPTIFVINQSAEKQMYHTKIGFIWLLYFGWPCSTSEDKKVWCRYDHQAKT